MSISTKLSKNNKKKMTRRLSVVIISFVLLLICSFVFYVALLLFDRAPLDCTTNPPDQHLIRTALNKLIPPAKFQQAPPEIHHVELTQEEANAILDSYFYYSSSRTGQEKKLKIFLSEYGVVIQSSKNIFGFFINFVSVVEFGVKNGVVQMHGKSFKAGEINLPIFILNNECNRFLKSYEKTGQTPRVLKCLSSLVVSKKTVMIELDVKKFADLFGDVSCQN